MAYKQHYRVTYVEYIRGIIGDSTAPYCLFNMDELASYIETRTDKYLTTTDLRAENNKYHITCGCGKGVLDLNVTDGVDGAVYILDEHAEVILFDPNDPENTATAPDDGDLIEVSFYYVNTAKLLSDLFMELSSNHTKLVAAQSIAGVSMDLKQLADAFYAQAVRWEIES